jgi:hypothetical protein
MRSKASAQEVAEAVAEAIAEERAKGRDAAIFAEGEYERVCQQRDDALLQLANGRGGLVECEAKEVEFHGRVVIQPGDREESFYGRLSAAIQKIAGDGGSLDFKATTRPLFRRSLAVAGKAMSGGEEGGGK